MVERPSGKGAEKSEAQAKPPVPAKRAAKLAARREKEAVKEAARKAKESATKARKRAKNMDRVAKQKVKADARLAKKEEAERKRRAQRKERAQKAEERAAALAAKDKARQDKLAERSLKGDKARKSMLDALVIVVMLLLVGAVVGVVGLIPLGIAGQTYLLAAAAALLSGGSFLFTTIRWEDIRVDDGRRMLNRGRADLILMIVSITALVTVVIMGIIEIVALLVFLKVTGALGEAGIQVANNFVLFQAIMLCVYLMAIVARQNNPSRQVMLRRSRVLAIVLTPLAMLCILFGVVLASGRVQVAGILPHQGVYVVTLGVLLEFIAMRIRLRLPSLLSVFRGALAQAKRPNEEMKDLLRQRAQRTYIGATVFVALSMALAGVVVTNSVALDNTQVVLALVLFYVGAALVLLGMLVVRLLQSRAFRTPKTEEGNELAALISQKRRAPEEIVRTATYVVGGVLSVIAFTLCVFTAMGKMGWHVKFATDFFILGTMMGAGPYGYFYNRELRRIAAIDEKFPDFLRDIAESARAGMTLPRALVTAAQGTYGALTPEIHIMAAQVEWGVDFGDALARFAGRCKTPLIDRTVALVTEAQRAGGSVVDVLTAASEDAREIKQILAERSTQMSMYNVVVYISFFVFIVVVLVLSAQFIPAFKTAVGAASGQQVGGLQFKDFDPEDFNSAFFQAALVQAIGGGLVGGVLTKGSPVAGFLHVAIMMALAWLSFRVVVGFL